MRFISHFFLSMSKKIKPCAQQWTPSPACQSAHALILAPPCLASASLWLLTAAFLSVPLALCPTAQSRNESTLSNVTAPKYSGPELICSLRTSICSSSLSIIHSLWLLWLLMIHLLSFPVYIAAIIILPTAVLFWYTTSIPGSLSSFLPSLFFHVWAFSSHAVLAFTPQGRNGSLFRFAHEWNEDLVLWIRGFH